MIGAGTTLAQFARALCFRQELHVVTHSTLALRYLSQNPSIELTFLGGRFDSSLEAAVGPEGLRALPQYRADQCFVGPGWTEINRLMAERAAETTLVADSSRFEEIIWLANRVTRIVTDSEITTAERRAVAAANAELHIVEL